MQELKAGSLLQGGKYYIEEVLGQGGFGITYLAMMKNSVKGNLGGMFVRIPVVIKEFFMESFCQRIDERNVTVPSTGSKKQAEYFRKEFIKEAHHTSELSHPNIVKVIEVFEENGTVYYVMEYLKGGSLRQLIDSQGPLPESQAVIYVRQIAKALGYMHKNANRYHLDVKPSNIMLNDDGQARLIDFGLSKGFKKNGRVTSTGAVIGLSPGFSPLEQYENKLIKISPQTDWFSYKTRWGNESFSQVKTTYSI